VNRRPNLAVSFVVRAIATALIVCLASSFALGYPRARPRPIDPTTFTHLIEAIKSEQFADAKLERLRGVAGGKIYLFSTGQMLTVLDLFEFWTERLDALRLLPPIDGKHAAATVRYFDQAPDTIRSEARRVLQVSE
jgi:hypothetical protein